MGDGTSIPEELIPRCPVCGEEAFPWVRGYGNFLQGRKYDEQYQKISKYIMNNKEKKDTLHGTGSGENDTDVYTGTLLEPDAEPSGCLLYCRKRTI